jgi:hypothetical protein
MGFASGGLSGGTVAKGRCPLACGHTPGYLNQNEIALHFGKNILAEGIRTGAHEQAYHG